MFGNRDLIIDRRAGSFSTLVIQQYQVVMPLGIIDRKLHIDCLDRLGSDLEVEPGIA